MTELNLTVSRTINAPAAKLFDAWLDPKMLAKFMLPGEGMTVPQATTNPVEGGRFEIIMKAGDQEMPHAGTYRSIKPHSQLIFTWESPFSSDDSTVTLDFTPKGDATEVVLRHVRFQDEESRDNHKAGWGTILAQLDAVAACTMGEFHMPVKTVSRQDWLSWRTELLEKEKELTRARDELGALRRALPRVRMDKDYRFIGQNGEHTLADLFSDRSQLLVYHFMFGPDWQAGCKSCSFWVDNFEGIAPHLAARDISLVLVSKAAWPKLRAYQVRMGWTLPWVSSEKSDFNEDFGVTHPAGSDTVYNYRPSQVEGEMPGISVFSKDSDGVVYHHYSTYSRGLDMVNGAYHLMDLTPLGRNEGTLDYPMSWLNRHDEY